MRLSHWIALFLLYAAATAVLIFAVQTWLQSTGANNAFVGGYLLLSRKDGTVEESSVPFTVLDAAASFNSRIDWVNVTTDGAFSSQLQATVVRQGVFRHVTFYDTFPPTLIVNASHPSIDIDLIGKGLLDSSDLPTLSDGSVYDLGVRVQTTTGVIADRQMIAHLEPSGVMRILAPGPTTTKPPYTTVEALSSYYTSRLFRLLNLYANWHIKSA